MGCAATMVRVMPLMVVGGGRAMVEDRDRFARCSRVTCLEKARGYVLLVRDARFDVADGVTAQLRLFYCAASITP